MIAIQSITKATSGGWTFTWDSDGSSFYRVVLWGIELAQVTTTSYTWHGQEYTTFPPPLEIASQSTLVTSELYVPYLVVQWYGENVARYLVQQSRDAGSTWSTISTVQEMGSWIYTFQTVILLDETTYLYQVIAVDVYGNESTPRQFKRYVVCPPAPPDSKIQVGYTNPNITVVSV